MKSTLLLFLLLTLGAQTGFAERQLLDRVVAVVNDEVVSQSELDAYLRPVFEQYKTEFSGSDLINKLNEARRKLLNQLIEDKLVYQEAKEQEIQVDAAEIQEYVEEFKTRFPNDEEFEKMMEAEGLTPSALEERMKRQAMIRKLHDLEIRSKIVVSPLEIEKYYEEHPEEFSTQDSIQVRSITIKKDQSSRQKGLTDEEAKAKLSDLRRQILEGADIGELAKQHSEDTRAEAGGLSDWLTRGTMIPVIDDVIFKLQPGEVSDLIETPMGYHIFRLEERREGSKQSLESVRDVIMNKLYRDQADLRFKEWMNELKKDSYISVH